MNDSRFPPTSKTDSRRSLVRSEERREGKACRSWWSRYQAEDGIRDTSVTGVQTCALPISTKSCPARIISYGWGSRGLITVSAGLCWIRSFRFRKRIGSRSFDERFPVPAHFENGFPALAGGSLLPPRSRLCDVHPRRQCRSP